MTLEPQKTVEIRVDGMDCASCEVAIAQSLQLLDGVRSVDVEWQTGLTKIIYDGNAATEELFRKCIEESGFTVGDEGTPSHVHRLLRPSPWLLLAGFLLLLPVLFVLRDELAYAPGRDAAFVPGDLNVETFSAVSVIAIGVAFAAGIATFFSPSMVAMLSVVLGYSTAARPSRGDTLRTAAGFALAFIAVDVFVGALYGGIGKAAIRFFVERLPYWNLLIAAILLAVGLLILRVWRIPSLRAGAPKRQAKGFRGAFILAAPFGIIDCPGCNPLLLPIALGAAASGSPFFGAAVMGAFGLGRGLLLIGMAASGGTVMQMRGLSRTLPVLEAAGGWLLLLAGLYFFKEFLRLAFLL